MISASLVAPGAAQCRAPADGYADLAERQMADMMRAIRQQVQKCTCRLRRPWRK